MSVRRYFAAPRTASTAITFAAFAPQVVASASSFGMSGVNAHAVFDVRAHGGVDAVSTRASILVADGTRLWPAPPARLLCAAATPSSVFGGKGRMVFESVLTGAALAFLWDHGVNGNALMPGAASLEAAHAALAYAEVSSGASVLAASAAALTGIAFVRPLVLPGAAAAGARATTAADVVLVVTKSVDGGTVDVAHRSGGNAKGQPAVVVKSSCRRIQLVASAGASRIGALASGSAGVGVLLFEGFGAAAAMAGSFGVVAASSDSAVPASSSTGFTVPPAMLDSSLHLMAAGQKQGEGGGGGAAPSAPRVPAGAGAYFAPVAVAPGAAGIALARQLSVNDRGTAAVSNHVLVLAGARVGVFGMETKSTRSAAGGASATNSAAAVNKKARTTVAAAAPQEAAKGLLYDVAWQANAGRGVARGGGGGGVARPSIMRGDHRGSSSNRNRPGMSASRPATAAAALMQTAAIAAAAVATQTAGGTLNTMTSSLTSIDDSAPVLGVVRAAAAELNMINFDVEDRSRYAAAASPDADAGPSSGAMDNFSGPHGAAVSGGARFSPTVLPSMRSLGIGAMGLTPQPRGAFRDLKPAPVSSIVADAEGNMASDDLPLINVRVEAVGLNFRDVLNVLGMYPGNPGMPGSDYAGVVIGGANEAGAATFAPGTEIFGLAPGCLGTQVTACALAAAPKPPGISFADAAGCPTILCTVLLALAEAAPATGQGLTLVHFSAQLEPCLTHKNTLHTLNTPNTPFIRATRPLRAPPIP